MFKTLKTSMRNKMFENLPSACSFTCVEVLNGSFVLAAAALFSGARPPVCSMLAILFLH